MTARTTLGFTLYILGAYALAAMLCVSLGEALSQSLGVPTHKIIGRGGLLIALLGFWPFLKLMDLADKESLGYRLPAPRFRRKMLRGFLVGMVVLLVLSVALLGLDIRIPREQDAGLWFIKPLYQGLLGGLAVGLVEETFFRGAFFTAIRRQGGSLVAALILPSLVFSALHFLKPQSIPPGTPIGLDSCMASLGGGFVHLFHSEHLDSLAALFMVGLFLALVRQRSGDLAWCIGLHAGWVLVIKLTHAYSQVNPKSGYVYLAGGYDGMIGWLAAGWLGLLSLVLWFWPGRDPAGS